MNSNKLYNLLYELRSNLKQQFSNGGRAPTICSDESLQELAAHPPRYKSDLVNIIGLGDTFVEKYGNYFMPLFESYYKENINIAPITPEIQDTLKSLENRLVNISRRNRLLYMGKISDKSAFDIYSGDLDYNNKVLDLLLGKTSQITLCEMSLKDNWSKDEKRFKKALKLIREVSKDKRESGQNDLFIGYPYVIGKTFGEDFNVRAPLVLFPVTFDKKPDKITIKLDKTKDILFNSNLILTQNKFLGQADIVPDVIWEDFEPNNFLEKILAFYQQYNINIHGSLDVLEKFQDILVDDFPDFHNGEYYLSNNALLGRFSPYSSAIQRDFNSLINSNNVNTLINDLLTSELCSIDPLADDKIDNISEKNINYINELNSSQEQAVLLADQDNELVIQGPPGTGKSQTITSLITDAVNKGKNVLMVSQKKAALDVIYSRLGKLSNFAIMINDSKNKSDFYSQMLKIFTCDKKSFFQLKDFIDLSNEIDNGVYKCQEVATNIYSHKINNTEVYKIYSSNTNNYWLSNKNEDLFNTYFSNVQVNLLKIDYNELCNIHIKFSNYSFTDNLVKYNYTINNYPFVADIKLGLKSMERKLMEKDFLAFKSQHEIHLKKPFLKKFFGAFKQKKLFTKLFKQYFQGSRHKKYLYKNIDNLLAAIPHYSDYVNNKDTMENLTTIEKDYLKVLYNLSKMENDNLNELNNNLKDFIIYCNITDFEEGNQKYINNIKEFPNIVSSIFSNTSNKIDLTKAKTKDKLVTSFYNEVLLSKRYMEICRQLESNRKYSVQKFIKKFSFELLRGIKVWLMTPETVSELLPMEYGLFDTLIFDEASQIYIEKGLPSITRARSVVIAGDHKQLRPSSLGFGRIDIDEEEFLDEENNTPALEEESILDLARFRFKSILLNYHYRSKYEELINFSNYAFYGGKLNVSPNIEEPSSPPIEVIKINNGLWTNRCNKSEAVKVVSLVKKLLSDNQNNETIGVITFNTNQRDIILDELDRECLKDPDFSSRLQREIERKNNGEDIGLFVKNIENVQGDERDHIIFSTGYARNEDGKIVRNFGWLNQQGGENRLNVAISRAKRKITVVTSIQPEELPVDDLKNNGPKLFRKYLEYCWAISNKDNATATIILNSLSEAREKEEDPNNNIIVNVGNALISKGLQVEYNIGYGNYKIDLAIKHKNKYILGIEFDHNLYKISNTRERDIFRQKYLTCRNWEVYRLWCINWWHNQEKEIDNILNMYNNLLKKEEI